MKPYSKDLRLRALAAVDAGRPRKEVAKTFSVSMPSIKRWLKRRRETGDVEPKPIPGRPSRKEARLKEWLPYHLEANDDLTLEEHREAFEEEFGEAVSTSTIGRAIAGLPDGGWPLKKKTLVAQERDEQVRGLWRWLASHFDARRIVFVDESGFNTSMTRLKARAPRGKRAYGKVPRNRGKSTTLIAAITLEGAMGESMTIEGATDALAFEAYVEHFLVAPSLCEGQVVVLDGLGAHRTEKVKELIEGRGAELVFLPSYSPDLNPIEEAFSKIKSLVRKEGARVREALVEVIGRALAAVTPEDAAGWFAHAGYGS